MTDGSEKRNRQVAFELQNSHVCEKRIHSKVLNAMQRQFKFFFTFKMMKNLAKVLDWKITL